MKIVATGDSFIARRLPEDHKGAKEIKELLSQSDVKFTNLEITAHKREGYPAPFSGGTWALADPVVIDDLLDYGFNLYNWANNHTMDYLYGGLLATECELDKRNLIHAGAGQTLSAASKPKFLETNNGRVAIIGATSTFHESWIAGERTAFIEGRPGVNPLRFEEIYYITSGEMEVLKEISKKTHIDANEELNKLEGFSVGAEEDHVFIFAGKKFTLSPSGKTFQKRIPLKEDLDRLYQSITEAKRQADYVLVSLHSHEMEGLNKSLPADFFEEACRSCIDFGAHAVLGHGPHVVRGIELYQERPIFYSLGNFIFQNDSVEYLPADYYQKYGLGLDSNPADGFDVRSDHGRKGLGMNPHVWESVITEMEWSGDQIQSIKLYPIELGFHEPRYRKGWPKLSKDHNVLLHSKELSKSYGTEITIENGVGYVKVN
ncbi:CapA family protein [Bacillaceae bacterium S4-13-58]